MNMNWKEKCRGLPNSTYGLLKGVKRKMSMLWNLRKRTEEAQKTIMEYFDQVRQDIRNVIEQLSTEFWDRVKDMDGCTACGREITKDAIGEGWMYQEIDYQFLNDEGKMEVKENMRSLFCPKCITDLAIQTIKAQKKKGLTK